MIFIYMVIFVREIMAALTLIIFELFNGNDKPQNAIAKSLPASRSVLVPLRYAGTGRASGRQR
jgi:hypothetical protein